MLIMSHNGMASVKYKGFSLRQNPSIPGLALTTHTPPYSDDIRIEKSYVSTPLSVPSCHVVGRNLTVYLDYSL